MATPFNKVLWPSTFNFLVGPNNEKIEVCLQAFGNLSQPMNTLINGSMMEATTGVCHWPVVDLATFGRFSEYAYVGDYTPPKPDTEKIPAKHASQLDGPGPKSSNGLTDIPDTGKALAARAAAGIDDTPWFPGTYAVPICSAFTPRRTSTEASTRALGIYVPPVLFSAADTHATTISESTMETVRSASCPFSYASPPPRRLETIV